MFDNVPDARKFLFEEAVRDFIVLLKEHVRAEPHSIRYSSSFETLDLLCVCHPRYLCLTLSA